MSANYNEINTRLNEANDNNNNNDLMMEKGQSPSISESTSTLEDILKKIDTLSREREIQQAQPIEIKFVDDNMMIDLNPAGNMVSDEAALLNSTNFEFAPSFEKQLEAFSPAILKLIESAVQSFLSETQKVCDDHNVVREGYFYSLPVDPINYYAAMRKLYAELCNNLEIFNKINKYYKEKHIVLELKNISFPPVDKTFKFKFENLLIVDCCLGIDTSDSNFDDAVLKEVKFAKNSTFYLSHLDVLEDYDELEFHGHLIFENKRLSDPDNKIQVFLDNLNEALPLSVLKQYADSELMELNKNMKLLNIKIANIKNLRKINDMEIYKLSLQPTYDEQALNEQCQLQDELALKNERLGVGLKSAGELKGKCKQALKNYLDNPKNEFFKEYFDQINTFVEEFPMTLTAVEDSEYEEILPALKLITEVHAAIINSDSIEMSREELQDQNDDLQAESNLLRHENTSLKRKLAIAENPQVIMAKAQTFWADDAAGEAKKVRDLPPPPAMIYS